MTVTLGEPQSDGPRQAFAAAIGETFELAPWVAEAGGRQAALRRRVTDAARSR